MENTPDETHSEEANSGTSSQVISQQQPMEDIDEGVVVDEEPNAATESNATLSSGEILDKTPNDANVHEAVLPGRYNRPKGPRRRRKSALSVSSQIALVSLQSNKQSDSSSCSEEDRKRLKNNAASDSSDESETTTSNHLITGIQAVTYVQQQSTTSQQQSTTSQQQSTTSQQQSTTSQQQSTTSQQQSTTSQQQPTTSQQQSTTSQQQPTTSQQQLPQQALASHAEVMLIRTEPGQHKKLNNTTRNVSESQLNATYQPHQHQASMPQSISVAPERYEAGRNRDDTRQSTHTSNIVARPNETEFIDLVQDNSPLDDRSQPPAWDNGSNSISNTKVKQQSLILDPFNQTNIKNSADEVGGAVQVRDIDGKWHFVQVKKNSKIKLGVKTVFDVFPFTPKRRGRPPLNSNKPAQRSGVKLTSNPKTKEVKKSRDFVIDPKANSSTRATTDSNAMSSTETTTDSNTMSSTGTTTGSKVMSSSNSEEEKPNKFNHISESETQKLMHVRQSPVSMTHRSNPPTWALHHTTSQQQHSTSSNPYRPQVPGASYQMPTGYMPVMNNAAQHTYLGNSFSRPVTPHFNAATPTFAPQGAQSDLAMQGHYHSALRPHHMQVSRMQQPPGGIMHIPSQEHQIARSLPNSSHQLMSTTIQIGTPMGSVPNPFQPYIQSQLPPQPHLMYQVPMQSHPYYAPNQSNTSHYHPTPRYTWLPSSTPDGFSSTDQLQSTHYQTQNKKDV